jgi:type II secretory pathway component PulF
MSNSFAYRVVDVQGRRSRGVGQAETVQGMTSLLESRGLLVLDVERVSGSTVGASPRRRIGRRDVLELSRGLAALLRAGLPLSRALSTASHIVPERVRGLLEDIGARTTRGDSLAAALDAHGAEFPAMYRGVVRAGERSGDLSGAFAALTKQMEAEDRLRARLLSASIYPVLLAVGGIMTCSVLVLFVLPRFAELLAGAQATLPRSTATLLAIASTLRSGWPGLLVLTLALIALIITSRRSARVKRGVAVALVRLPIVGQLRRYADAARFARLTGVLLEGGAPLLTALDDVLASIADPVTQDEIKRVRARVHDGAALHRAVAEGALFPPVLARLVAVGEESGRLEEFLISAAELCEERAERILQRLVALAEPAMILVFGVLVAFVALSLLQALYGIDAGAFR